MWSQVNNASAELWWKKGQVWRQISQRIRYQFLKIQQYSCKRKQNRHRNKPEQKVVTFCSDFWIFHTIIVCKIVVLPDFVRAVLILNLRKMVCIWFRKFRFKLYTNEYWRIEWDFDGLSNVNIVATVMSKEIIYNIMIFIIFSNRLLCCKKIWTRFSV